MLEPACSGGTCLTREQAELILAQNEQYHEPLEPVEGYTERNFNNDDYKNIYEHNVGPGVYATSNVYENINSNYGINRAYPMRKKYQKSDDSGNIFLLYDEPDINDKSLLNDSNIHVPIESNIRKTFDPRHNGYGDNERNYNFTILGQPRFAYDDVDAIKMPNYITRSNVDHIEKLPKYGSENLEVGLSSIRDKVEEEYLKNQLKHRNELQERLMRKQMDLKWQRRYAPIQTNKV